MPGRRPMPPEPAVLQTASPHPLEWPLTCSNSQMDHVNNVPCPLYVRARNGANWLTPRTGTDSVRTSGLTCSFTVMVPWVRT